MRSRSAAPVLKARVSSLREQADGAIERAPQLPRLVLLALVHSTAVLLAAVISSDVGGEREEIDVYE